MEKMAVVKIVTEEEDEGRTDGKLFSKSLIKSSIQSNYSIEHALIRCCNAVWVLWFQVRWVLPGRLGVCAEDSK
jgi:hypothetical protein